MVEINVNKYDQIYKIGFRLIFNYFSNIEIDRASSRLELFEQDLHVHARMEEDVLIPKALKAELNEKLSWLIALN